MNKKAVEWHFLVLGIIAIITMIVVIFGFKSLYGKGTKDTDNKIDSTSNDFDCDGVMNVFDRCCETKSDQAKQVGMDGCAPNEKPIKCTKAIC